MKLRPLIMDNNSATLVETVVKQAEQNKITLDTLKKMVAGTIPPIVDTDLYRCVVPFGYRCVFSIEQHPGGWLRHLSVSVEGGPAPNEHAVDALMTMFGFKTSLQTVIKSGLYYLESLNPQKAAVNIMESYEA